MAVSVTRTRSESIRDWVEEREPFFCVPGERWDPLACCRYLFLSFFLSFFLPLSLSPKHARTYYILHTSLNFFWISLFSLFLFLPLFLSLFFFSCSLLLLNPISVNPFKNRWEIKQAKLLKRLKNGGATRPAEKAPPLSAVDGRTRRFRYRTPAAPILTATTTGSNHPQAAVPSMQPWQPPVWQMCGNPHHL